VNVWLAFRPDLTDRPDLWSHAVVPIYSTSNWREIRALLQNELRRYIKVAAIDSDSQKDRLKLVRIADVIGFDRIELDEQLESNSLTVPEYNELKKTTALNIGITSAPDPCLSFILDHEGIPDFMCVTTYSQRHVKAFEYVVKKADYIPVIGVLNFADPRCESSSTIKLAPWTRTISRNADAVWFWGHHTGNAVFEERARVNFPLVQALAVNLSERR